MSRVLGDALVMRPRRAGLWDRKGCAGCWIITAEERAACGSSLLSGRTLQWGGLREGSVPPLWWAIARSLERQKRCWAIQQWCCPGFQEANWTLWPRRRCRDSETRPCLSHASQPHRGQLTCQPDHANARCLPSSLHWSAGGRGVGLLLLLLQGKSLGFKG